MPNDLRYAIRGLLRAPGFSIAAIITLAIGIGANIAIVSVIDAALVAPLPFRDADRLVTLRGSFRSRAPTGSVTPADFNDYRARAISFDATARSRTSCRDHRVVGVHISRGLVSACAPRDPYRSGRSTAG